MVSELLDPGNIRILGASVSEKLERTPRQLKYLITTHDDQNSHFGHSGVLKTNKFCWLILTGEKPLVRSEQYFP